MQTDSDGTLWIGQETGLLKYDAEHDYFVPIPQLSNTWIRKIIDINKQMLFLLTHKGPAFFYKQTGKLIYLQQPELLQTSIYDAVWTNQQLYLAGKSGLFSLTISGNNITKVPVAIPTHTAIIALTVDAHNHLWLVTNNNQLHCYNPTTYQTNSFNQPLDPGKNTIVNFSSLVADKNGRIWITSNLDGLLLLQEKTGQFSKILHNPLHMWTPSTNLHYSSYCDKDGNIWLGGNNGVNYYTAEKKLFQIIPVFDKDQDSRNRRVARIAVQDQNAKLWFGTIDGLVLYDSANHRYREWNNRPGQSPMLHYNSIRGLVCDDENNIWIATGRGINLYNQQQQKMIFFTDKDSIPQVFYFSADTDRVGNIWFSCRDKDGLYFYSKSKKKFYSLRDFPGLEKFAGIGCRKLMQDSKGRYWLGFNGSGLGMYDPVYKKHYQWQAGNNPLQNIAGNSIVDIQEDYNGVIWISTFTGLTSINPNQNFAVKNYHYTSGLINNSTSALAVDKQNRLWIGTGSGLVMFDSARKYFTSFGLKDGLPSVEFPEHAASGIAHDEFLFPTQNGFVRFNPNSYQPQHNNLRPYFTHVSIPGKTERIILSNAISLKQDENFFTIGFAAINYHNAAENWYAYKLDGIDEDWKYTQHRFADYTKIPGGNYTFRVKASGNRQHWNFPETVLNIHIDTIFYNTIWFRILIASILSIIVFLIYKNRLRQRERLMYLQSKAQNLEKEKALVMYESLKQQLNPHFLFNSLSALSGIIEADQKMAGMFLEQMSKIYRYILKSRDSELVPLKEEIDFVQSFIRLQKARFGDGLQVNIQTTEPCLQKKIVPVTLQNLLENALKHNIVDTESPLSISISTTDDGYLEIKNNLQKKKMIETSNKQGLTSLKSLYKYLSKKPIEIKETNTIYSIRIPLIES